ncbi:hypothetical protein LXM25_02860 [Dyadobacter sp. LJ53]|uniref:hypothetical protein n=1 Tax=Dyadobacter chenwenxiniae TaxID=2906456 RepID=UPI001F192BF8|nr:hypothetical protein [Dyadobacter chenwenxiniae]MCF0048981.1 hypothetical protein [Dyadobacter chenwenxiniae]
MRLSEVKRLIDEHSFYKMFAESIAAELGSYKKHFYTTGTTLPIHVTEDIYFTINLLVCQSLSRLYHDKILGQIELAYIVDALQLSEKVSFTDEETESILGEMTDPEINGDFTINRAAEIMAMRDYPG